MEKGKIIASWDGAILRFKIIHLNGKKDFDKSTPDDFARGWGMNIEDYKEKYPDYDFMLD